MKLINFFFSNRLWNCAQKNFFVVSRPPPPICFKGLIYLLGIFADSDLQLVLLNQKN